VRSGRAGFVVLAWPCGDPDILSGDGEISLNFQRRTECPVYGLGLLVPAGPGLGVWLGGTAESRALPFRPSADALWGVVLEANSRFLALLGMTTFN